MAYLLDIAAADGGALDGASADSRALNGAASDGGALDGAAADGRALDGAAADGGALGRHVDEWWVVVVGWFERCGCRCREDVAGGERRMDWTSTRYLYSMAWPRLDRSKSGSMAGAVGLLGASALSPLRAEAMMEMWRNRSKK